MICDLSDLPVEQCGCRIVAGDLIVQVGADGAYVHEECADRA